MSNFKRKYTSRKVRCTLCTNHKWLGNHKQRTKAKYRSIMAVAGE